MNPTLIFVISLAIVSLAYSAVLSGFALGLHRLRKNPLVTPLKWPAVSVVLPARNESAVLQRTLDSLFRQDYPGQWEIVVVDDRSTDETPQIIRALATMHDRLRVVTITEPRPTSPKKNAVAQGIKAAIGEIIVTTDADCEYHLSWLRSMISHMTPDVGVVAGLTVFDLPVEPVPDWQRIQWLDFAAQQFIAAGAAGFGVPSSCNGSNLAYRRRVYDEISGFGASAIQISGDDVLFAQRVALLTKWKTVFAREPETIVRSLPVLTIREMLHQRLRWASKGLAYRRSMLLFLFGIYLFYLMLLIATLVAMAKPEFLVPILGIMTWKLAWDYGTIRLGCSVFGQRNLLPYFLPFSILHTLLSPIFGIGGLFVSYRWKGEWYRTARLPRSVKRSWIRARRLVRGRRVAHPTS